MPHSLRSRCNKALRCRVNTQAGAGRGPSLPPSRLKGSMDDGAKCSGRSVDRRMWRRRFAVPTPPSLPPSEPDATRNNFASVLCSQAGRRACAPIENLIGETFAKLHRSIGSHPRHKRLLGTSASYFGTSASNLAARPPAAMSRPSSLARPIFSPDRPTDADGRRNFIISIISAEGHSSPAATLSSPRLPCG